MVYPLVNVNKKLWKDPPFYSWVNQLFSMAIFNSKLFVYRRVYHLFIVI